VAGALDHAGSVFLHAIASLEKRERIPREFSGRTDVKLYGIGDAVDDVEQRADAHGISNRLDGHSCRTHALDRGVVHAIGLERQGAEQAQHGPQPVVDGRTLRIVKHGRSDLFAECRRRDRAVRFSSEDTSIELGRVRREQLPLAHAPFGGPSHRVVDEIAEGFAKEFRPIEQGLDDVGRIRSAQQPNDGKHQTVLQAVAAVQHAESHWFTLSRAASPFSRRARPAPTAAQIVASNT